MDRISRLSGHLLVANPTASAAASSSSSSSSTVKYEILPGRIALITLNRPTRGNAFTSEMQEEYMNVLDRANASADVGAIVLTGAGKMFCVGADKEDLSTIGPKAKGAQASVPTFSRDVSQVHALEIEKPIICAINGGCAGLGLVVACMADVRFASAQKDVKFTTAFAKRGLIAEHGISYVLPRIVGQSRAMDLLLSSRVVLSEEALAMGLVNKLFPDADACLKGAIEYARDMVKYCSPAAMAEIKRQIYSSWGFSPREEAARAETVMLKSFKHPDFKEGVASLVEKRDPQFQGFKGGFIRDIK